MVTFSTIVAYQKSQRNTHNGLQVTVTECATRRRYVYSAISTSADPWRYAAISIECVACNCGDLSTIVAYPKSQRNLHNGLQVTVTECATRRRYVYLANSTSADPWRYAAISIECFTCNCGDLFNDRGISIKPEKHA